MSVVCVGCNTCVEQFAVVLFFSSWGCCDLALKTGGQMSLLLWPGFQFLAACLSDTPKALLT